MSKTNKPEIKLGYIQVEKAGKKTTIPELGIELPSIERDQQFKIEKKLLNVFKKKQNYLIPLYKGKMFVEKQIRPSILSSLEEAFQHAVGIKSVEANQKLAYMTIRAMNIVIKQCTTVLCVGSQFDEEQKDITYVDNFCIYRKVNYNSGEMQDILKDVMPDVYENIKEIRGFQNIDMPKLFLTKEEEDIMMMIKQGWKTLAIAKNVSLLHIIQEKIKAHKELE